MAMLGSDLKKLREERKITLEQIARETRISLRHLQGLEEGRYSELPGGMYNRAFLRSYCEQLGVDPAGFLKRYANETASLDERPERPEPPSPRHLYPGQSRTILTGIAALLLTAGAVYFGRGWVSSAFGPYVAAPASPAVMTRTAPAVAEPDSGRLSPMEHTEIPAWQNASSPGAPGIVIPDSQQVLTHDAAEGSLHLSLEVVDDCWVSLHSDGNRVLVRLMRPGEDITTAAEERFYMILGNAAGVNLKINGKPLRPLGESGDVVKLVITEKNLHEFLQKSTG